ncbi:DMP19 family protein [Luteimonas sp. Y-2-2-4F]|nr:DUF4375 domain-containing protein [Luteimonas sp. Y-2-2-4F]MCD9031173.1 DMP19 family protein [Luteimonas sp. Y-2-2-4F]
MTAALKLVDVYYTSFAQKADAGGITSLSDDEQVVLLSCWAKAEIDNGGFANLYSLPVDIEKVENAFTAIGLMEASAAVSDSKKVFPEGRPPDDLEERTRIVEELVKSTGDRDPWYPYDKIIWSIDSIDEVVENYILRKGIQIA